MRQRPLSAEPVAESNAGSPAGGEPAAEVATAGSPPQPRMRDAPLVLKLESSIAAFEAGREALQQFIEAAGAGEGALYRAELVFEELVVNVIRHGQGGREASGRTIDVSVWVRDEEIILTVEDDGPPFNPLEAPAPPRPASIEEARIGGLGLPLVRSAGKRLAYERRDGRNRVTVAIGLR